MLNHNLAYCYNDARVIKWMWENVKRGSAAVFAASKTDSGSVVGRALLADGDSSVVSQLLCKTTI
jgi:hypothetical protein